MASVVSKNISVFTAAQFLESVSESSRSNLYLSFGRVRPWANDSAPDQANTSVSAHYDVWSNMIGAKKVTGNDIRHVIPRIDWTSNTSYNIYDHCDCSLNLFDANTKFYVVTDDWNVYKCISNNNGSISTVKPTSVQSEGSSLTPLVDGYVWKYMYTINAAERLRFTTENYIPVKTLTLNDNSQQWAVQDDAIPGSIDNIIITNAGSNYNTNVSVVITGDGTGANAFPMVNVESKTISSIVIDAPGQNYTFATVTIKSANGVNATAKAIISPPGGHGSDPLYELGGSNLMINMRIKGSENGHLSTKNDFRQIALIQDPLFKDGATFASNTVVSQLTQLSVNGSSVNFREDEIVYQGTTYATAYFTAVVAEWNSSTQILKLSNVVGYPRADIVVGRTSGAVWYVNNIIDDTPELKTNSGKLLYIDNIKPVARSVNQTEDFKIVLKF